MGKKLLLLTLCFSLVSAFALWGATTDMEATDATRSQFSYDPDAKINLNPSPQIQSDNKDDGRAFGDILMTIDLASIGMPGDGYDNAGLTWDGQYLYLISMYDNQVYVIDPTGPTIVTNWAAASGLSWGFGHAMTNLWMTEYNSGMAYEYTFGGTATGNSFACVKGGASWMGDITEWWDEGEIWMVAVGGSNKIYKFTVPAGTCVDSLSDPTWTSISQRGLSYDPHNNVFFIGGWNDNILWELDSTGAPTGRQVTVSSLASIAYDWQSTIHPTPVIWAATNEATNRMYMLDADNPVPPPPENILYVDDDDGGTTETYWETSFANLFYAPTKWVVADSGDTAPDSAAMADYTIVVWSTAGDYSSSLTSTDTTEIGKYLNAGGKFWLSSQDVLYDIGSASWMHITGWTDDMGITNGTGIDTVMSPLSFALGEGAFWDYADILVPDGTSWTSVVNDDYNDTSSVAMDTTVGLPYFLYFNAFGWENIVEEAYRDSMMARVLTWMGYPPDFPAHDVGAVSIDEPGGNIMPNTTINPQATYYNFGESTDTFDIYFVIDSSGTPIYDETAQMILPPASGTTYTYATQWTSGPDDGITYDIAAYTVMTGDANAANDTVTSTCTTQSFFWKIYSETMPNPIYYHATAYSEAVAPTIYSLGGDGANITAIYEFDVATETWSTPSATLNHASQRNAAAAVGDKIYCIGGCDASWNEHSYVQEYDPVAGTVTDVASMPTARYFLGALAWRDTLIYAIGGQAGSYYSTVEIYDPASDSWTTGTALPITNRSFACGIWGDTIYVAGGWNGSYIANAYMGVIDSLDPTSINWTALDNIPNGASGEPGRSRVQGACTNGGVFYFTCGDDHGVVTYDTWYWDGSAWQQAPDKPTAISNTQCAVFVPTLDGGTFFCPGGYNTVSGSGTNVVEGLINVGVGVEEEPVKNTPLVFGLSQNAPNPVKNGYTAISYTTAKKGPVSLKVYDKSGRLIRTLRDRKDDPAGQRTVYWDGKDNNHRPVSSGIYFYRLTTSEKSATRKIVVIK